MEMNKTGALVVLAGARLVGRGGTPLLEGRAEVGVLAVAGVVKLNKGECYRHLCLSPGHGGTALIRSGRQNPGNNLHVSGLSHKVDTRDLEAAFAKIGRVHRTIPGRHIYWLTVSN